MKVRLKSKSAKLTKRLEDVKKSELKRGAKAGPFDANNSSAEQITDEAMRIQGQDKAAVRRMQRMVGNTEEVAAATMSEMQRQTEQLGRIHQDLEEIDDTLKTERTG